MRHQTSSRQNSEFRLQTSRRAEISYPHVPISEPHFQALNSDFEGNYSDEENYPDMRRITQMRRDEGWSTFPDQEWSVPITERLILTGRGVIVFVDRMPAAQRPGKADDRCRDSRMGSPGDPERTAFVRLGRDGVRGERREQIRR